MHKTGEFVWFECVTPDTEKAKAFYTEVIGWKVEDMPMGDATYDLIKVGDAGVGGFMKPQADGVLAHWLTYLSVADVDAAAKRVVASGGKTVSDAVDIPDVGRMQVVSDPHGGTLSLFRSAHGDPDKDPVAGTWHWNELWSQDADASLKFYSETFDLGTETMEMPEGPYHMLQVGGKPAAGLMRAPDRKIPTMWMPYVIVDDVEATISRAKQHDGKVLSGDKVIEVPGVGAFAHLQDPTGAILGIIKPAER
ncbi:MAG: VOC family protein [Myxococcota bacterium]